jgi:regulator of cell morphogenesis and NO signaling
MKPTLEQTLGALATQHSDWRPVMEALGLDFCCGGRQTLDQAAQARGLDPATTAAVLEALPEMKPGKAPDPASLTTPELIDHIVSVHHAFVRDELPRLLSLAQKVQAKHGDHDAAASGIYPALKSVASVLLRHLDDEEVILFPRIRNASQDNERLSTEVVAAFIHDHEEAGDGFHRLRELTGGFQAPEGACTKYRLLVEGLHHFEADLHEHVHLENNVLFSRLGDRP